MAAHSKFLLDNMTYHYNVCYIIFPSETVNQQLQGIQQQLYAVAKQRDDVVMQLTQSHEKNTQYAASLGNLQMVLEQFQQGKMMMILMRMMMVMMVVMMVGMMVRMMMVMMMGMKLSVKSQSCPNHASDHKSIALCEIFSYIINYITLCVFYLFFAIIIEFYVSTC